MLARCACVAFLAVMAGGLTGCCSEPWGGCYPCGKNFCGPQCGQLIWHYWFSLPPQCCDPCDGCGNFTGPRLNDSLYSHGNDYHGWCEKRDAHFANYEMYEGEEVQGELINEPTPAPPEEPYYSEEPDADVNMPFNGSTRMRRQGHGRHVSHYEPIPPRGHGPKRATSRRLFSARPARAVDSRPPNRKLARPPRTRLFSR